jgi:hypothetical protein
MTQIGISTQQIGVTTPFATDISVTVTIAAVDLSRSYVMFQGYASGKMLCVTCPVDVQTPKGTAKDAKTGQWAVELLTSTSIRLFRTTPTGIGCRHTWFIRVIEYT